MEKQHKDNLISIVIPVYNAASFLEDTIYTVQNQTYQEWELILVDDSSTDDSRALLQKLKNERIKTIFLSKNGGPAAARNVGIREAKGRYLSFLDADDLWDKKKLEKQLEFMRRKDCAFSFTGYEFANEAGVRNGKIVTVPSQITYKEALKNTTISTITVMFDRYKIPTNLLLMPEDCPREDSATWWQILKNGYKAYGLNEALSVYRRHAGSHSANKWNAVKGTWSMYRKQEKMSVLKAMYYIVFNLMNAVKRRL